MAEEPDIKQSKKVTIKPEEDDKPKGTIYGKSQKKIEPISDDNNLANDNEETKLDSVLVKEEAPVKKAEESQKNIKLKSSHIEEKLEIQDDKEEKLTEKKTQNSPPKFIDKGQYHVKISKSQRKLAKKRTSGSELTIMIVLILALVIVGIFVYLFVASEQDFGNYVEAITDLF